MTMVHLQEPWRESHEDANEYLLASFRDGDSDDCHTPSKKSTPAIRKLHGRWREHRKTATPWLVVSLLAISLLLWNSTGRWHDAGSSESAVKYAENEYVLDPDWDFGSPFQRREYEWTISDTVASPDGVYRPMIVINGQLPGPLVEVNSGDVIVVHVKNEARNATAIHWHGMYQNGTNHMDGTVGITQCPIAPGQSFTYEFNTTNQAGTFWYHGHRGVQASDGLLGPLIIHSRKERELQPAYASDQVLMVQDHYYNTSSELIMGYLKNDNENAEPIPNTALLNGRNIRNCDSVSGFRCDSSLAKRPMLSLEPGKSHRLRIINVGAFAEFQLQIDEHEFAVTEADGTDLEPALFHRLNILPAQRYSIVVNATGPDESSFWLRARMVTDCFAFDDGVEDEEMQAEVRAIVRYAKNTGDTVSMAADPHSRDWPDVAEVECRDMNTSLLHPAIPMMPPPADAVVFLRSNFEIGDWQLSRGFFNQSSWRGSSTSTTLNRFISGIAAGNDSFVSSLDQSAGINEKSFDIAHDMVYQTSGIKTVDIVVSNFDDGAHPMHLHGHQFFVLAKGRGNPPLDTAGINMVADLENPLRRDTATIDAYGWLILRVVLDNPGIWAFHCHITWHAEAGLLMQFLVRADDVATWSIPAEVTSLCADPGVTRGERPSDEYWFGTPQQTNR